MRKMNLIFILGSLFFFSTAVYAYAERLAEDTTVFKKSASKIGTPEGLQYRLGTIGLEQENSFLPVPAVADQAETVGVPVDSGKSQSEREMMSDRARQMAEAIESQDKSLYRKTQGDESGDDEEMFRAPAGDTDPGRQLDERTIQAGDLLEIIVYPQENLSSSRYVDNEGYLFFPYLGKIRAAGLSVSDFEKNLTEALEKDYLEHPRIFVRKEVSTLERWRESWRDAYVKPILVYAQGRATAFYPTRAGVTLLEVLSRTGIPPASDLNQVRITRSVEGGLETFYVNAQNILDGKAEDIVMQQEDILFIPTGSGNLIHIFGEVNKPGPIDPVLLGEQPTLVRVISLAGGFTRIAAPNRVRIVRVVNDREAKIKVDAKKILKGKEKDIVLEPGDIIIVPESFW
ncbi:MAG TPA: polysaccharide biosynthesis/export family protein [bacterium]|nr:polysaccharide biosynthesis/export family protein [bacterium]